MKSIKFKEATITQKQYWPNEHYIYVHEKIDPHHRLINCYKLSIMDRIRILFTGKIWYSIMTFNKPITPYILTTKKSIAFITVE